MGIYLNPGNDGFQSARAGRYVDKSGLIAVVNETIGKSEKLTCISRARRFGKSYAAKMLSAYYDRSCDSSVLFDDLEIAGHPSYRKHLNKYNVVYLDITNIIGKAGVKNVVDYISDAVMSELMEEYPSLEKKGSLDEMMGGVVDKWDRGQKFITIIDEWDAVIRDSSATKEDQKRYLEFLRSLFKSSGTTDKIFAAAYMTGILPIKKDGSQSAISEFREYTMLDPGKFGKFVGFTEQEVKVLCEEDGMDFEEMKRWYDGYSFEDIRSVYNPNSVIYALDKRKFESYWAMSSSATSLLDYINMDFDGLADAAADLLAGKRVGVRVKKFQNDLVSLRSKDDVLTLLTHFGYLSYDSESETVIIPNQEIRDEFSEMIHDVTHEETLQRVRDSIQLIKDTAEGNADAVAAQIEKIHRQECTPLHYNREQSLRAVIKMAYFAYRDYYLQFEELPGGTGYADIVYLPKKYSDYPALIIELKWADTPETAIHQIRERNYPEMLKNFDGDILLVGISYDKEDAEKKHHCRIEVLDGSREENLSF
ncbi:MAG: AAA family ATPase [Lachnospiraceae bacterium]|nr:AAA family ATPase [Lachnospiraceae bacterium]